MPLKTNPDIEEAVETVTKAIQEAARQATEDRDNKYITEKCPIELKEKLREKRKARKRKNQEPS
jgi:20S proteasome alpha/beta subunit